MSGRWVELADGVLVRRYRELDLSVGLVLGGDTALVVDTRSDPEQGAELRDAVRSVTRLPCRVVVLTHAHFDHCLGTAAFLPATVWAHRRCRADLALGGAAQFAEALSWAQEHGAEREPVPVRPVVPDRTVHHTGDPVRLDLGGREVVLYHPGRGHTDHDLVVHSPDTGVLFAGDLVEQGADPDFTDAWPLDWPTTVTAVLELGAHTLVPGHGDPVDSAFVTAQRDDLAVLAWICQAVLKGDLDEAGAVTEAPFGRSTTLTALSRLGTEHRPH